MSHHHTEAVAGLLDGQLKGVRLWLVKRHVSACPVCAAEYRHQQHVRRMLQANPPAAAMNDSPEFFWSKVKTEIQRRGEERFEAPMPRLAFPDWLQQHQFAVATAAASLIVVVGILWFVGSFHGTPVDFAKVEQLRTTIPNTAATTFDSEDAGVTVIWVSGLPWTHDMNEMKTEFANLDT
jgi:predicted anti-sigma-YlaC factor YlaD